MKTKTTTLRTLLGRIKDRCDLIVVKGASLDGEQRYWRRGLVTEMDDWQFEVTKAELNLIQEVYGIFSVSTFNLDQPVKKGKSVRVKDTDGNSVIFQFVGLTNLNK